MATNFGPASQRLPLVSYQVTVDFTQLIRAIHCYGATRETHLILKMQPKKGPVSKNTLDYFDTQKSTSKKC